MTYQARVTDDDKLELPPGVLHEAGLSPGDLLSIARSGRKLVLEQRDFEGALARLRAAMRGYGVDQFLADRGEDWNE